MSRDGLVLVVPVAAPAQAVWDELTDWESQGEWMPATTVRVTSDARSGAGATVEAFSGWGRLGVLDTMVVTEWDPPRRCVVRHTGRIVRGPASFEVLPDGPRRSRVVWSEQLEPPFGQLGRLAWPVVEPLLGLAFRLALRSFARQAATRHAERSAER